MLNTTIRYLIAYTVRNVCAECQKVQTLTRRGVGDAVTGLGLHFLHMSKGSFLHDAGHIEMKFYKAIMLDTSAVCLDLDLSIESGDISSKICDKRNDFYFNNC